MRDDVFNRRLTAGAGVFLAVFFLVGLLLPGAPPKADDSLRDILEFFNDSRGSILAGDFFVGLGGLGLVVFAGGLSRYLRSAARDDDGIPGIAFGGAVAGVALLLAGTAVLNGLAFESAGTPEPVRQAFDTANALFFLSGFPFAAFFGGAAWAGARRGALPAWTNWLGGLAAVAQILGGIGLFAESGFFATGGAMGFLAPMLAIVWAVSVSVCLFRGTGVPAASGRA